MGSISFINTLRLELSIPFLFLACDIYFLIIYLNDDLVVCDTGSLFRYYGIHCLNNPNVCYGSPDESKKLTWYLIKSILIGGYYFVLFIIFLSCNPAMVYSDFFESPKSESNSDWLVQKIINQKIYRTDTVAGFVVVCLFTPFLILMAFAGLLYLFDTDLKKIFSALGNHENIFPPEENIFVINLNSICATKFFFKYGRVLEQLFIATICIFVIIIFIRGVTLVHFFIEICRSSEYRLQNLKKSLPDLDTNGLNVLSKNPGIYFFLINILDSDNSRIKYRLIMNNIELLKTLAQLESDNQKLSVA